MKNIIEYFYRIEIEKIIYKNDVYIFLSNNRRYIFKEFNYGENINFLEETQKYNLFHKIIFNFQGDIFTTYNGKRYILMKINIKDNRKISLYDILNVSRIVKLNNMYIRELDKLWKLKIDNFESYTANKCSDFVMREYYDYFIGLGENAISYYRYIDKSKINYGFTYKRIYQEYTLYDLYDPTNIIIAPAVRGLAEYVKMNYFYGKKISVEDIVKINFSYDDAMLFVSRLLFPTYFFDLYKKGRCDDVEKIKKIIARSCSYEKYIFYIIEGLKKRQINLPQIKWIKI